MKEIIKRLTKCVNEEMNTYGYSIKDYSEKCEVSYSVMRKISSGKANDALLSTIEKICDNSHFEMDDVFARPLEIDIEKILSKVILVHNNKERYTISASKFKHGKKEG